eukprot:CAMPEP_0115850854 /NCGR_PEP_ID=MMETSP0287-20121206/12179_1 /TAXON_ID=412157 /ORGANISM="Chrysochromulina rotalis, Strain UIO044" /LENGTH=124 /DNA_ID=CAMNT_0003304865 /DNA_START=353 /DNA_END=724 /DNA_ORIENTATION=+
MLSGTHGGRLFVWPPAASARLASLVRPRNRPVLSTRPRRVTPPPPPRASSSSASHVPRLHDPRLPEAARRELDILVAHAAARAAGVPRSSQQRLAQPLHGTLAATKVHRSYPPVGGAVGGHGIE